MKRRILLTLFSLILISCGKNEGPRQDYIVMDEKSSSSTESLNSELDRPSKTKQLNSVTFEEDTCESNSIQTDVMIFSDKIESLGGTVNEVYSYDPTMDGLQKFLNDSGATNLNASDFSLAGTKSKMEDCSLKDLTPPKSCWYRTLTLALISEKIENETGIDLKVTSHYRNKCYNKTVGGANSSDHIGAKAIDISLGSQINRHKVEQYICDQLWKENYFATSEKESLNNISIGIGETFLHIGIDSIHGRRHWVYDNYISSNTMPSTCWIPSI